MDSLKVEVQRSLSDIKRKAEDLIHVYKGALNNKYLTDLSISEIKYEILYWEELLKQLNNLKV